MEKLKEISHNIPTTLSGGIGAGGLLNTISLLGFFTGLMPGTAVRQKKKNSKIFITSFV